MTIPVWADLPNASSALASSTDLGLASRPQRMKLARWLSATVPSFLRRRVCYIPRVNQRLVKGCTRGTRYLLDFFISCLWLAAVAVARHLLRLRSPTTAIRAAMAQGTPGSQLRAMCLYKSTLSRRSPTAGNCGTTRWPKSTRPAMNLPRRIWMRGSRL